MHLTLIIYVIAIMFTNKFCCFACDCFSHNESFKCLLGTKTPYRLIANYNDSMLHFQGCTEKKIWFIIRHGTRYPGEKHVSRLIKELPKLQRIIIDNYNLNKTELTDDDAELFAHWKLQFTEEDTTTLAKEGENELIDLGERFQSRFPSLMLETYSNESYKFKHTATQRTKESARNLAAGLFGWHNSHNVWYFPPEEKDSVLRFYKRCLRWQFEVDKNPSAYREKEAFLKSKSLTDTLDNVSKRIAYSINYEIIHIMHTMCSFETAWNEDKDSPWCKLFSLHDFKVLEFVEDLEHYWIDGYGYHLTYEQACIALQDMFTSFTSEAQPTVIAYFTHSGSILKLLTLLGIANDSVPLTHRSFLLNDSKRAWRTSLIDSFASNIAFVLYDCESIGPSILTMHQERIVNLVGCPPDIPCPITTMKALYPDTDEECDFDAICAMVEQDPYS